MKIYYYDEIRAKINERNGLKEQYSKDLKAFNKGYNRKHQKTSNDYNTTNMFVGVTALIVTVICGILVFIIESEIVDKILLGITIACIGIFSIMFIITLFLRGGMKQEYRKETHSIRMMNSRSEKLGKEIEDLIYKSIFITEKNEDLEILKNKVTPEEYQKHYYKLLEHYHFTIDMQLKEHNLLEDKLEYYYAWRDTIMKEEKEEFVIDHASRILKANKQYKKEAEVDLEELSERYAISEKLLEKKKKVADK